MTIFPSACYEQHSWEHQKQSIEKINKANDNYLKNYITHHPSTPFC